MQAAKVEAAAAKRDAVAAAKQAAVQAAKALELDEWNVKAQEEQRAAEREPTPSSSVSH